MWSRVLMLTAMMNPALSMSANAHVPPVPPAPQAPLPKLQRWMPGEVRCGETTFPATQLRRPLTALSWGDPKPAARLYQFNIDQRGRPVSVRGGGGWDFSATDIAPSLAATRFPVKRPLHDCTVAYTADPKSMAEAPRGDLVSYSVNPDNGELPPAAWARIKPEGADCNKEPRTQWLKAVSPDYLKLPGEPGARDWTLVGYDLDAHGRPEKVHEEFGTGNATLARAAVKAMSQSRLTQGPRRGCLQPFVRLATRLPAPADVDVEQFRPVGANCTHSKDWARLPPLVMPENWRRRAIEGWAILTFDVAPWGATGNIHVVASEPSEEFGQAAVQIIAGATKASSPQGMTGCVERVRYKMGPGTPEPRERS